MTAQWFVLRVKSGSEISFNRLFSEESSKTDSLTQLVRRVYVPVVTEKRKHRRYKGIVHVASVPAFPGYVFAELNSPVSWRKVKEDSRVLGPILSGETPFVVSGGTIDEIKELEAENFHVAKMDKALSFLGQKVAVEVEGRRLNLVVSSVSGNRVKLKSCGSTATFTKKMELEDFVNAV